MNGDSHVLRNLRPPDPKVAGSPPVTTRPVLMDHDGGVDDYLALALLLTIEDVQPIGVVVTPADCYVDAAVGVTRKLLDLMGRSDVAVARSTVRGANPFPRLFRRDSLTVNHLPILNERPTVEAQVVAGAGQSFMARTLLDAPAPVTVLATGPLTTVAAALDEHPEVEHKIAELVWMGGALEVAGNVDPHLDPPHDGSAEWNAYWDPLAVERVWRTQIPVVMCPLDLTNRVPVTADFVRQLSQGRHHPLYDFAGQCYALVMPHFDYYCWDVLTTAYVGRPDLFTLREVETAVVTEGCSEGRVKIETAEAGGRRVRALSDVRADDFYRYLLHQWKR